MTIKPLLTALVLATVVSTAALAAGTTAAKVAAPAADAAKAATEKCEVTKDGKTTTTEVAVGTCEKDGGKVVTDAPAADATAPAAPAEKK